MYLKGIENKVKLLPERVRSIIIEGLNNIKSNYNKLYEYRMETDWIVFCGNLNYFDVDNASDFDLIKWCGYFEHTFLSINDNDIDKRFLGSIRSFLNTLSDLTNKLGDSND